MTPEQAKKLLPIIQAFAEGKVIQYRHPASTKGDPMTKLNEMERLAYMRGDKGVMDAIAESRAVMADMLDGLSRESFMGPVVDEDTFDDILFLIDDEQARQTLKDRIEYVIDTDARRTEEMTKFLNRLKTLGV